jgi:hypothetical protein
MTTIGMDPNAMGSMGGESGGGVSLNSVSQSLGQATQSANDQLESFMSTMDPQNMNDIMQLQMYMIEWETTVQTESSVYKGIGDTLKSVANNVGS